MTTYYDILGVSEQATPAELRQAYRRLVLLTHPDRTPDAAAHALYLLINEAYDVLSIPDRRLAYDAQLQAQRQPRLVAAAPAAPLHRDPALRRTGRPAPRRAPKADPYAEVYARYAPWARRFCQLMLVFCGLLLLDFCWTLDYPREVVQAVERHTMSSRRSGIVTHYSLHMPHANLRNYDFDLETGTVLTVRRSALFRQVRQLAPVGQPLQRVDQVSVYGNFFFAPVLLAVVAAVGARKRSPYPLTINCSLGCVLLLAVVIYFLQAS
ncbi:J domain-containing protein [Hymenobacter tenuis]